MSEPEFKSDQFDFGAYSLNPHFIGYYQSQLISEMPLDCDEASHREYYKIPVTLSICRMTGIGKERKI